MVCGTDKWAHTWPMFQTVTGPTEQPPGLAYAQVSTIQQALTTGRHMLICGSCPCELLIHCGPGYLSNAIHVQIACKTMI